MNLTHLYDVAKDGVVLRLHVQPGAGKEAIIGTHGNALKVRVVAPPVSGRANQAVLALLSRELGVESAALTLTSGETGRVKRVKFAGLSGEGFETKLRVALEGVNPGKGPARR